jgi:hypothetical protein
MQVLCEWAALLIVEGEPERAAGMLRAIMQHPGAEALARARATELLESLGEQAAGPATLVHDPADDWFDLHVSAIVAGIQPQPVVGV